MPWKQGYTISDERSIADAEISWPGGHRCCVTIVVDLSLAAGPEGMRAADLMTPVARFAIEEGIPNLLGTLRRHGLRATFATPAAMARILGPCLREIAGEGHEIAVEGLRHEDASALNREDEKARLRHATEILEETTGKRPAGWFTLPRQGDPYAGGGISPHTIELLLEAGYQYFGNGPADDAPHWWVSDFAARRAILALPYHYHFDDQFFCMFPQKGTGLENPDMLLRNWRWEFEAQHARGRHFHMVLHPQHMGFAHRLGMLNAFLSEVRGAGGVWNATGEECAAHWSETFPAETHLRLEPSIWQDHPGSLS
jgi:peptidoglycan/xylan/chitin deacetylase (PgdA/CDA1 family)